MVETNDSLYQHPLTERYASPEMQNIFATSRRYGIWRRLWLALASVQGDLGLSISQDGLKEMEENLDNIDLTRAAEYEQRFRHDVMAHVHLFGDDAPSARGIIHLGATSAFITDKALAIVTNNQPIMIWRFFCSIICMFHFRKRVPLHYQKTIHSKSSFRNDDFLTTRCGPDNLLDF